MRMIKLYQLSKKLHRLLVLIISASGLAMAATGLVLKYPRLALQYMSALDLSLVRYLHNKLSPVFAAILCIMALTGLAMYVLPIAKKNQRPQKNPSPSGPLTGD